MERGASAGENLMQRGVALWHQLTQAQLETKVTEFIHGLPVAKDDLSLVVTQVDFTQTLYAENKKVMWGVDLGTTRVLLAVPARVHYAVDLTGAKPVRFEVDSAGRIFRATFPDPEVLAVEIFDKDKRTIVETGWGRLKSGSGEELKARLEDRKYRSIRDKAMTPDMQRLVRERSRPVLARFIALYLQRETAWGPGPDAFARIEVRFAGDDPQAVLPGFDHAAIGLEPAQATPLPPASPTGRP
jgi:hypothetical protein